jgi:uncharacterized protein (DUF362 family)
MTEMAVISMKDRIYGVNKAFELLEINPVKGRNVIFKPNFNATDPSPASNSMETIKQIIMRLKELGVKSIKIAERSGPANSHETFMKKGLSSLAE